MKLHAGAVDFASRVHSRVPDGWRIATDSQPCLVLQCDIGSVTIDVERRAFALGVRDIVNSGAQKYTGRGWRERLVDDAVKALQACRRTA